MTEFTKGILVALIPALIVSVVSAYITTRLSIRNFYSQKWWEKKAEAYSRIMQSLVHLKYCYENWMADLVSEKQLSDNFKKELSKQYGEAKRSLEEATSSGAFIISDKAASYLEGLKDKWEKVPLWQTDEYDHYAESLIAVGDCISKIRSCAKADLHKN
jgi:translation initiation factor 2 alpha subunit (eIF-2alpha)